MTDGEKIRAARYALGMTQVDFAKAIGVSKQCLCMIERGKHRPSAKTRDNIRRVLSERGMSADGDGVIAAYQSLPIDKQRVVAGVIYSLAGVDAQVLSSSIATTG